MPLITRMIQIFSLLVGLGYLRHILNAAPEVAAVPPLALFGTVLTAGFAVAYSVWIASGIQNRRFRSHKPVTVYLWVMLLFYILVNILRMTGFYVPRPEVPPDQMAGAALLELLRYPLYLTLIIWSGFSKRFKQYFHESTESGLTQDPNKEDSV